MRTAVYPKEFFSITGSYGFVVLFPLAVLWACVSSSSHPSFLREGAVVSGSAETSRRADLIYNLLAGELAVRRADLPAALKHYLSAARQTDDLGVLKSAVKLALHDKDYASAIRLGEKWRKADPDNLELKQLLIVTYALDRRFENAMQALEDLIGKEGINENRIFTALGATLLSEMPVEAHQRMKEMAERFSDNAKAQYVYAVFLLDTGDYDAVAEFARKAVELDPGFATAYLLQGWAIILNGRVNEGLATAAAGVAAAPDDVDARANYAKLLLENGRQREALREFQLVYQRHPYNADVVQALGILSMQQEDFEAASAFFDRLGNFPGRRAEAVYYAGRVAEERGEMEVALTTYRSVPQGAFFKKAQISIAEVYRKLGDLEKAIWQLEATRMLVDDEQEKVEFYLVQGEFLKGAGFHYRAIEIYTQAMKEHGDLSSLLYARGLAAAELGLLGRVEADLGRILQMEPENADALNSLGYTFANHNIRLDEAKAYILRAYKLQPDNPAILDSMGWVEFRLNNVEVAEAFIRQAIALLRHPEVFGHLVEILCSRKRVEEASTVLEEALAEFPKDKYLQRLREGCAR